MFVFVVLVKWSVVVVLVLGCGLDVCLVGVMRMVLRCVVMLFVDCGCFGGFGWWIWGLGLVVSGVV